MVWSSFLFVEPTLILNSRLVLASFRASTLSKWTPRSLGCKGRWKILSNSEGHLAQQWSQNKTACYDQKRLRKLGELSSSMLFYLQHGAIMATAFCIPILNIKVNSPNVFFFSWPILAYSYRGFFSEDIPCPLKMILCFLQVWFSYRMVIASRKSQRLRECKISKKEKRGAL